MSSPGFSAYLAVSYFLEGSGEGGGGGGGTKCISVVSNQTSFASTYLFPLRTSGLQYSSVPQKVPKSLPFCRKAAEPKSMSLIWKCSFRMMFSSLMSRCTIDNCCR